MFEFLFQSEANDKIAHICRFGNFSGNNGMGKLVGGGGGGGGASYVFKVSYSDKSNKIKNVNSNVLHISDTII